MMVKHLWQDFNQKTYDFKCTRVSCTQRDYLHTSAIKHIFKMNKPVIITNFQIKDLSLTCYLSLHTWTSKSQLPIYELSITMHMLMADMIGKCVKHVSKDT